MFIEIRCKNCGKRFSINFGDKESELERCPKCRMGISSRDSERIWHLTETYFTAEQRLEDISICGIHDNNKNVVISSDIDSLNNLYNISPPETRQRMTSLFDLFYLLMFHDSKNSRLTELDDTIEKVRKIFEDKVEQKHEKFKKTIEGESSNG